MYPAGEAVLRGGRKNLWPTTVAKRRANRPCVLGLPLKKWYAGGWFRLQDHSMPADGLHGLPRPAGWAVIA